MTSLCCCGGKTGISLTNQMCFCDMVDMWYSNLCVCVCVCFSRRWMPVRQQMIRGDRVSASLRPITHFCRLKLKSTTDHYKSPALQTHTHAGGHDCPAKRGIFQGQVGSYNLTQHTHRGGVCVWCEMPFSKVVSC